MAKPSPSVPHSSPQHPDRHVDIKGSDSKIHQNVSNNLGATAIGGFVRSQVRDSKGK